MSTLPPEGNHHPEDPESQPETGAPVPPAPEAEGAPPPAYQPPPPGAYQPPPPGAYQQPPPGAPAQPGAPQGAPGQPQQPYGQPQQPYGQPQPGYGPPPGQPGQPGQYQQPYGAVDPAQSNITLNYWLSVFFTWIPALIFYVVDKDKQNPRLRALQTANLNFALMRVGVGVATWLFVWIPYLGAVIAFLGGIFSIVLFVFHIIAAAKSSEAYRSGTPDPFIFNLPLVK